MVRRPANRGKRCRRLQLWFDNPDKRSMVDQLAAGVVLRPAVKYQHIAQSSVPRDNH